MEIFRTKRWLGGLLFIAVFAGVVAIVMLLWNALLPSIFGLTAINYWQAGGLMILSRLLLGGFGRFGKFGRGHHHFHGRRDEFNHWHFLRDEMKGMSRDEKREYIREQMSKNRDFGFDRRGRGDFPERGQGGERGRGDFGERGQREPEQ